MNKIKAAARLFIPNSLQKRVLLLFGGVFVFSLAGLILATGLLTSNSVGRFIDEIADQNTANLVNTITDAYYNDFNNDSIFFQTLLIFERATEIPLLIFDENGQILASLNIAEINPVTNLVVSASTNLLFSQPQQSEQPSANIRSSVVIPQQLRLFYRQLQPVPVIILIFGETRDNTGFFYVNGSRGTDNENQIAISITSLDVNATQTGNLNRNIFVFIISSSAIAGLVALIVLAFFTTRAFKPVTDITNAVDSFGRGDFSQRVKEGGTKEIKQLSSTFNEMATKLQNIDLSRKQLTADISHELRTPLTSLKGYIEAIQDKLVKLDDDILNDMWSQTEHLANIVNDLGLLAIADSGELKVSREKGNVAEFVREIVRSFQPLADENQLKLKYKGTKNAEFDFDAIRLRQIVNNLVTNAIKYTPEGGSIKVEIGFLETGELTISVSDTGEGIAPEHIDNIMERFYRTDQSRSRFTGGSGLGLTIVKKLTELHNGSVDVVSKVGKGSTFTVILPP